MTKKSIYLLLILFCASCSNTYFQKVYQIDNAQEVDHSLILLANTYNTSSGFELAFDDFVKEQTVPTNVLFIGDLVHEKESNKSISVDSKRKIERLTNAIKNKKNLNAYFLTGDYDWDDSREQGHEKIKALEILVEKELGFRKALLPSKGCPGPKTIDIDQNTVLIAINSQWFIHPYKRAEAPNTDCKILTDEDFWEELKDEIEDAKGKNIIIAAHHPVYSNGQYAGRRLSYNHLIPVIGSFKSSYLQEVGRAKDMAYYKYQIYIDRMRDLIHDYNSIIYVSGHENTLEVLQQAGNYHINSGTASETKTLAKSKNTLFKQAKKGWIKLNYYKDAAVSIQVYNIMKGEAKLVYETMLLDNPCDQLKKEYPDNTAYIPCQNEKGFAANQTMNPIYRDSSDLVVGGQEYTAGKVHRFWMGDGYRDEWTTKVKVPYLDLDQKYGGLKPFAKGGGLQTHSLKFDAGNGNEYAFRSINKDPVKALNELERQTIYKRIVKDLITTQHPYGALVAAKLLDATDILHVNPELYIMPDDPSLGIYQADFGNAFGSLELRPKKPKKGRKRFANADGIVSSSKMFRYLYKENTNRIDAQAYAKARAFDMFVGDWDRHKDNWKWAQYKKGEGSIFKPIPRDRDHVFSHWTGVIPSIADFVVPNAEDFDYSFKNISQLNFKGHYLDRQLGTSLTLEDWLEAAKYIQDKMTNELIDEALATLPSELSKATSQEIADKLKSRRTTLATAVKDLYKILAKEVDVVGSNQKEVFEVVRQFNGDVEVKVYTWNEKNKKKGELFYNRTFINGDTKQIRLFGLAADDIFQLSGIGEKGILIRIIGGEGIDKIEDESETAGVKRLVQIYDTKGEDQIKTWTDTRIKKPFHKARYDNHAFQYNSLTPIPKFRISSGNGFGGELLLTHLRRAFNKPDYAHRFQVKFIFYTIDAQRLDIKTRHRYFIKKWDLDFHLRMSSLFDKFPFFFGIGNETVKNDDLFDDEYYRTDFNTVRFTPTLKRIFLRKSEMRLGFTYEYNNVDVKNSSNSIFNEAIYQTRPELKKRQYAGVVSELTLDFRDNPKFTRNGSKLFVSNYLYSNLSENNKLHGRLDAQISHYETFHILRPITFIVLGGFSQTYGDAPFYHMSVLGSNAFLRTYFRNRFIGERALFLNTEARLHLGSIRTAVVPIRWGFYGFMDMGRVYVEEEANDSALHRGYGVGLYAAPLNEVFSLIFTVGQSKEDNFYFNFNVGFKLQ